MREEAERYNSLQSAVAQRDALRNEKEHFYDKENAMARIAQRASGPSNSELQKKKNQILQLIMKLQMEQSQGKENDSTQGNLITTDESDNAISMTDKLVKAVDISVLKGGASVVASDYLKADMGLNSRSSVTLDNIDKTVKEYEKLCRQASVAQTFSRHANYNGDSDDLVKAMYKNLRGAYKG